ncbi:NAD(P)H-dependent oxidoreductase [Bacillus sp. ISL-39]|uniref:NADPH-dependent FMN reductase n=1 Tax=Bacillus sp. ISL-39 TaxID=2819124 RepID=UPI001BEB7C39|nr:NAD(P)H-dependent oxidoreductase [Bacillus sp. ISL-39]MBT2639719.1 NAD(P)H-dependent oxidoreductase [Bacillus sp. ISL-39]
MKILGISGTILGAKTAVLVEAVLKEIKKINPQIETKLLDLRNYDMQFCDGRNPELYNEDTKKIIKEVRDADIYLVGSPIFNGSMPAPLKNVFDLIPPDVFRHKVMGFVANGGTYQHYLVIENQLKPIAGYFRCFVAPSYVYANANHFNVDNEIIEKGVLERIHALAEELVIMQAGLKEKALITGD